MPGSPPFLPSAWVTGAHRHAWLFTWMLGFQTQILLFALQVLSAWSYAVMQSRVVFNSQQPSCLSSLFFFFILTLGLTTLPRWCCAHSVAQAGLELETFRSQTWK